MKRCFYSLMAVVGLLLSTACSNEDEFSRGNGNEALVSFDVELSGGMQTKTVSDGKTAKNLVAGVFEVNEDGTVGEELPLLRTTKTFEDDLTTTVTFNLVKGKTYSFVFWAQAQGKDATSPYDVTNLKSIKVSYDGAKANDEKRDAFLAVVENKKVEASFEESVTLKRPFAQLNFLTDDIDKAAEAGLQITETTQSAITISNAATTLNPFTKTVSGQQDVTFAAAAIPAESETYVINDKSYRYLGTTYFLVDAAGTTAGDGTKQATLNSTTLQIEGVQGDGLTVTNVPAQWNYRTNIYGSLLTAEGKFNVEIVPDYDGDHNEEVQTKEVATVDEVDEAIAAGATEVIVTEAPTTPATITIPKMFENGNQTTVSISIPETTVKVTVSESTTTGEGANNQAPKEVVISCPNMNELEINLPNSTVKLEGSFGSITATTADNTLIIPEDVKVTSLTVNKGNVEIYGTVETLNLEEGCVVNEYGVADLSSLKKATDLGSKCKQIKLLADIENDESFKALSEVTIDLNQHTLTLASQVGVTNPVTIKNGIITGSRKNSTNSLINVGDGGELTMDGISLQTNASAVFVAADGAKVTIKNSTFAVNAYAVTTNASTQYTATILLENSTFESELSPILLNVPVSLTMNTCTVVGGMHGVVIRGATAVINDCDITLKYDDENYDDMANYFLNRDWATGNEVNLAALTIGNKSSDSYQYPTDVTLTNTRLHLGGQYGSHFPSLYAYANQGEGLGVTLKYDDQCTFADKEPVYGSENIIVNGQAVKPAAQQQ